MVQPGWDPGAFGIGLAAMLWLAGLNGLYYESSVCQAPKLLVADGRLRRRVLPHCSLLHAPYRPTWFAYGTHLQTVLGLLRKFTLFGSYNRQLILGPDGGTAGLDWWRGCDRLGFTRPDAPIMLVLHGINGGSQEGYCKHACEGAIKRGWRGVVLNYRGCNGLPITSPRVYNATMTSDVHLAISSIKSRFPGATVYAAGYSLGALILAKYLAEADQGLYSHQHSSGVPEPSGSGEGSGSGSSEPTTSGRPELPGSGLAAAALVSSPVCFANAVRNLSEPWTLRYLYNLTVAMKLRAYLAEHSRSGNLESRGPLDVDAALNTWTLQEIEECGLQGQFGFDNRHQYMEAASSLSYLPLIRTPSLCLLSTDDPFLGVLPDLECAASPHTVLAATSRGGHVAFTEGLWPFGPAFMDHAVMQFFENVSNHYYYAFKSSSDEAAAPAPLAPRQAAPGRPRSRL